MKSGHRVSADQTVLLSLCSRNKVSLLCENIYWIWSDLIPELATLVYT